MFGKKILASLILIGLSTSASVFAVFEEIECSNDAVFAANSCSQCFTWWSQEQGANIGILSDIWLNTGNTDQLVYKEEQELPSMISLGGASWSQTPWADNFWEYTWEFNELYSEIEDGYVLSAGEQVSWIKSKLGYAYKLDNNPAANGENIGLLVYNLTTHSLDNGNIDEDGVDHRECVVFTSQAGEAPVVEEPKRLPETGAEHVLLLMIALLLGFGFFKFRKQV